ncbi:thermonuclease family protein [Paenibacillus sp. Lou8.1]|uniref:thermonuclease family protein n=1 Tax=Paenibacillus sp. Lou8.1 TaxID=2962041 RepID=UPI0020B658D8|nr:thermonuclease family protein [Paenibacillus sp. Lou8.1]MCP3807103.1 thermonuclease family protein [Paenibacillus sp. Lou8.1]
MSRGSNKNIGTAKILGFLFIIMIVLAIIQYFGLLIIAGGLGYWGYKRYQIGKAANQKSKSATVLFSLAGIFFVFFLINITVHKDETKVAAPTVAPVEQTVKTEQKAEPVSANAAQTSPVVTTADPAKGTNPKNRLPITLIEGTDGDTFKALVKGKEEKIRLLLVDTPESVKQGTPVQPFAKEASDFTLKQLKKGNLELELDISERDKYGRLLGYVWVGDKMLNEQLLEQGYARVAYVYQPNVKYVDQFEAIQTTARKAGVGIWSLENYAQEDGFHEQVAKKPTATVNSEHKHNSSSSHDKPSAPKKEVVMSAPEPTESTEYVFYKNCSEAKVDGAAPLYEGEPGYRLKLDRDHDGVACER